MISCFYLQHLQKTVLYEVKMLWLDQSFERILTYACLLRGVYPFHDGQLEDFAPIFELLIKDGINDAYSDEYTDYFLPTARRLVDEADKLAEGYAQEPEKGELRQHAIDKYLRACTVLRISRFPSIDATGMEGLKRKVWEEQKRGMHAKHFESNGFWPLGNVDKCLRPELMKM